MKNIAFVIIIIALFLSACSPGQVFGPTITLTPTNTPTATATQTLTPLPTNTTTPTPTPTVVPTNCPVEKVKFVYPKNGQTIDYVGSWLFMVQPVTCSNQYLWGFYQNDNLIFESESSNEFVVQPYSIEWNKFKAGFIEVSVKYIQNDGTYSDPTIISLYLR